MYLTISPLTTTYRNITKPTKEKEKEKTKKERERKEREVRVSANKNIPTNNNSNNSNSSNVDRKHLHNYRVVQRNLVYVIGMPSNTAGEEIIRKPEYFGQYGKIVKTVIHRNNSISLSTVSAYVTFGHREDARAAIQALDGYWLEGHQLRASFGTTKYCNSFVRGIACANPDCVYLHDFGEDEDRYTKEDIVVSRSVVHAYCVYCVYIISNEV